MFFIRVGLYFLTSFSILDICPGVNSYMHLSSMSWKQIQCNRKQSIFEITQKPFYLHMRLIIIIFYVIIIVIIIIEVSLSTMLPAYEAILIRVLLLSISRKKAVVFWKNFFKERNILLICILKWYKKDLTKRTFDYTLDSITSSLHANINRHILHTVSMYYNNTDVENLLNNQELLVSFLLFSWP